MCIALKRLILKNGGSIILIWFGYGILKVLFDSVKNPFNLKLWHM